MKAACVLIQDLYGNILTVSRKDDHTNIGLPGGKIDEGESAQEAAIREALEETGYTVRLDGKTFVGFDGDTEVTTFSAYIDSSVDVVDTDPQETGVVKFVAAHELLSGSFAKYNLDLLLDMGILHKYEMHYTTGILGHVNFDDIVYETSSLRAMTQFIIRTRGLAYIQKCVKIEKV